MSSPVSSHTRRRTRRLSLWRDSAKLSKGSVTLTASVSSQDSAETVVSITKGAVKNNAVKNNAVKNDAESMAYSASKQPQETAPSFNLAMGEQITPGFILPKMDVCVTGQKRRSNSSSWKPSIFSTLRHKKAKLRDSEVTHCPERPSRNSSEGDFINDLHAAQPTQSSTPNSNTPKSNLLERDLPFVSCDNAENTPPPVVNSSMEGFYTPLP